MDPRGPVKFHNVHACSMWKPICRLTISRDPSLMPKRMSCCIGSGTARVRWVQALSTVGEQEGLVPSPIVHIVNLQVATSS